jgi:hypothetical protein
MKTKIQIKSIHGKLLFEFEKENNTIKDILEEAIRQKCDLRYSDLSGINLSGINLSGINLRGSNLSYSNLSYSNLSYSDLGYSNLSYSNLSYSNLSGSNMSGSNMSGINLSGINLRDSDLKRIYSTNTILSDGELIIWKKLQENLIAKLLIPTKAKRVNAIGYRKCRFEYAKIIAIYDGKKRVKEGLGIYSGLIYKVGEIVKPDEFDKSPLIECSHGIHGFITRQEAEYYIN